MRLLPLLLVCTTPLLIAADAEHESAVKFALYSAAWGGNTNDGMRLVVHNQTSSDLRLDSLSFQATGDDGPGEVAPVTLALALQVPAAGYAQQEFDYVDLLAGDQCVTRSLADNWKLTEISNYTLNPSVRNLIIEDTDSFRIYQCVQSVHTRWTRLSDAEQVSYDEWVLFHFESRRD